MYYYDTPNYSVALNAKVASSSMARAIIAQFQQRDDWLIRTAVFPPGVTSEDRQWHWLAHGSEQPTKPVVLLVRDPIDRFLTACQQVRIRQRDVDAAIDSLVNDTVFIRTKPDDLTPEQWAERQAMRQERAAKFAERRLQRIAQGKPVRPPRDRTRLRQDVHFFHQHRYAIGPTHCFKFPRDITAVANFIGISFPLPESNRAKRPKPRLSQQQEQIILNYYSVDKILFDSIIQPNYIYVPQGV